MKSGVDGYSSEPFSQFVKCIQLIVSEKNPSYWQRHVEKKLLPYTVLSMIHHLNCLISGHLIQNAVSTWGFLRPYHYPLKRGWWRYQTCCKKRPIFPRNDVLKGITFEEMLLNKQIINTLTWTDVLYHVSYIFPDQRITLDAPRLVWFFDLELFTRHHTMHQNK